MTDPRSRIPGIDRLLDDVVVQELIDVHGRDRVVTVLRDAIGQSPVYTVAEAADVVWQATHGRDREYIVGKAGRQANFARRFMPNRLRKRMKAVFAS